MKYDSYLNIELIFQITIDCSHGYGYGGIGVSKVVSNVGLPSVVSHGINPYGLGGIHGAGIYGGLGVPAVSKVVSPYGLGGVSSVVSHGLGAPIGVGINKIGVSTLGHGVVSPYGLGVSHGIAAPLGVGIGGYGVSSLGHGDIFYRFYNFAFKNHLWQNFAEVNPV